MLLLFFIKLIWKYFDIIYIYIYIKDESRILKFSLNLPMKLLILTVNDQKIFIPVNYFENDLK